MATHAEAAIFSRVRGFTPSGSDHWRDGVRTQNSAMTRGTSRTELETHAPTQNWSNTHVYHDEAIIRPESGTIHKSIKYTRCCYPMSKLTWRANASGVLATSQPLTRNLHNLLFLPLFAKPELYHTHTNIYI
jgi:hypothetical protein